MKIGAVLKNLVKKEENVVIAITPMHTKHAFRAVINKENVIPIVLKDTPENLFERMIFTNKNNVVLDVEFETYKRKRKKYYTEELRKDIRYYDKIYESIPNKIELDGAGKILVAQKININC